MRRGGEKKKQNTVCNSNEEERGVRCYIACRWSCLILALLFKVSSSERGHAESRSSTCIHMPAHGSSEQAVYKHRFLFPFFSSPWLLKRSFQEEKKKKTNTSRTSPEASSKFSTPLALLFLLQRGKSHLWLHFTHTRITRSHYCVFRAARADLSHYALNVLCLIGLGNGDEAPLISIAVL